MQRIAEFQKVSFEQYQKDWLKSFPEPEGGLAAQYDQIRLPRRATAGSAGYDFFSVGGFRLAPQESILIPTGIRVLINPGYALFLFPRSGLGFKYRFQLDNSVGIIDSDYSHADNEGHIFFRMTNDSYSGKTLEVKPGEAFAQGIFLPFGLTIDDDAAGERHGGFGSTTGKEQA